MSVLMASVAILIVAAALVEYRAIRVGDERRRHAPGYAFVMGGLVVIGIGIAAAASDQGAVALLATSSGLAGVVLGVTGRTEVSAH